MSKSEHTVTVKADVEGIGDGETHTIDISVAETVGELIKQNLRNRYEHLDNDTEIDVLALSAPNKVAIHHSSVDGESE
jgi:hypothetical protein